MSIKEFQCYHCDVIGSISNFIKAGFYEYLDSIKESYFKNNFCLNRKVILCLSCYFKLIKGVKK